VSKHWLQKAQEETMYRVLMSQTESYEPYGRHKVWSPRAKTVKEDTKNDSKKSRKKQVVGNRKPAVARQSKERE